MTDRLRILGIDPGSRVTGFGIVDFDGDRAAYVASGAVNSTAGEFSDRLKTIFDSISAIVDEYRPDVAAVESVFVSKSAGSALKLGHARSAAICATFGRDIGVVEYAPRAIKQAVVGTGGATKTQVQHMVVAMLRLQSEPSPDAADALAAAICHGHQRRLSGMVSATSSIASVR